jgi:hypothetical protein
MSRTGSGKSTLMIDRLFHRFIRNTRRGLLCTEPRVVLTESNVNDVIEHNKWARTLVFNTALSS